MITTGDGKNAVANLFHVTKLQAIIAQKIYCVSHRKWRPLESRNSKFKACFTNALIHWRSAEILHASMPAYAASLLDFLKTESEPLASGVLAACRVPARSPYTPGAAGI